MSDYCEICGEEASRATWDGKQEHPLCESCCRAINSEDETEDEANV